MRNIPQPQPGRIDVPGVLETFAHRMMYSVAKDAFTATDFDLYIALAYAVRDRLMERWFATQDRYYRQDVKRVYYLSLEFLVGRTLLNNVLNLGARDVYAQAAEQLGLKLEALAEQEWDAGLGNGGLGRLAACLMDSAATLGVPFYGYGIRYEYGIFQQKIRDGGQVEYPDNWLRYGNPWEIPRPDALFPVHFHGRTHHYNDENGQHRVEWVDTQQVWAMAYDTPVLGFGGETVNTLRLWAAKSSREFDLERFNAGEYVRAVEDKTHTENISKVLYPPDDQYAGKELRLKQQYFFVSATLQDVIRRFRKRPHHRLEDLPEKVAIQLNDTHPVLGIPELMRVLVDRERLDWATAWGMTQKVFAYTNHTVLPEALETWPVDLIGSLLPRHLEIIQEIDRRFRVDVTARWPHDAPRLAKMAVLEGGRVRMANLAVVGSHSVNGVAKIHTGILRSSTLSEMAELLPERFNNKTNGVTPRRWLLLCNPDLASLVTEAVGEGWARQLDRLRGLSRFADDAAFRERWAVAKRKAKAALAEHARSSTGVELDPEMIFDCHVKRIHEYKRQLLNALHVIALYQRIQDGRETVPRAVLFAGKAAPGYAMAKLIIRLIHAVAEMVNGDPVTRGRLRVAFLPNYSVSLAERIFPACELSEQISTAGTEASGTGNMKAALNGALTIGTLDGANIEIRDEVGDENLFIFGLTAEQVAAVKASGYDPRAYVQRNLELRRVIEALTTGPLEQAHPGLFRPIADALLGEDRYLHCADFAAYLECQQRAEATYRRRDEWLAMSVRNTAGMGYLSSDRTVREYAAEIWGVPTA